MSRNILRVYIMHVYQSKVMHLEMCVCVCVCVYVWIQISKREGECVCVFMQTHVLVSVCRYVYTSVLHLESAQAWAEIKKWEGGIGGGGLKGAAPKAARQEVLSPAML